MMDEGKPSRQEKWAKFLNVDLNKLESLITEIVPSTNKVTKKEIMSIISLEQKSHVNYHLGDRHEGLTIQHLDPRQNEINSVRLQFMRHSGHFIKEGWETWKCHQEECNFELQEYIVYFVSFGKEPFIICRDRLRPDDVKLVIGASGSSKHLFQEHPDFVDKKLGKMGVKVTRN